MVEEMYLRSVWVDVLGGVESVEVEKRRIDLDPVRS